MGHALMAEGEHGAEILGIFGSRKAAELEAERIAERDGYSLGPIPYYEFGTHLKDQNGRNTDLSVWTLPVTRVAKGSENMRIDPEVRRYLSGLPVLYMGQADDCVLEGIAHIPDAVPVRVWMSRCAVADGQPPSVNVEVLNRGSWETLPSGRMSRMILASALRQAGYTGGGLSD